MLPYTAAATQDTHHSMIHGAYGSAFPYWDWLCGTQLDLPRAVRLGVRRPPAEEVTAYLSKKEGAASGGGADTAASTADASAPAPPPPSSSRRRRGASPARASPSASSGKAKAH